MSRISRVILSCGNVNTPPRSRDRHPANKSHTAQVGLRVWSDLEDFGAPGWEFEGYPSIRADDGVHFRCLVATEFGNAGRVIASSHLQKNFSSQSKTGASSAGRCGAQRGWGVNLDGLVDLVATARTLETDLVTLVRHGTSI